jgi:hypothetical protein
MCYIILIIGVFILGIAVAVLVSPATLRQILHQFLLKKWLVPVTFLRVVVGIVFLIAAPGTRSPLFMYILGILFILAGVSIPLLGKEKIEGLANWWLGRPDIILRIWAVLAAILGLAIIWVSI